MSAPCSCGSSLPARHTAGGQTVCVVCYARRVHGRPPPPAPTTLDGALALLDAAGRALNEALAGHGATARIEVEVTCE